MDMYVLLTNIPSFSTPNPGVGHHICAKSSRGINPASSGNCLQEAVKVETRNQVSSPAAEYTRDRITFLRVKKQVKQT